MKPISFNAALRLVACSCALLFTSAVTTDAQNSQPRQAAVLDTLSLRTSSAPVTSASSTTPYIWMNQGMSVDFPSGWDKVFEKPGVFKWSTFSGKSKSQPADAMWFGGIVTISNKEGMFEGMSFADAINYEYDEAITEQRQGKFVRVEWLKIDNVKGYVTVQAASRDAEELRFINWKIHRVFQGKHQLLAFSAYTSNRAFDRHYAEMQSLLSSIKFTS